MLRLIDAVVPVREIGAGIKHLVIEKEPVKVVSDIVMELDEIAVFARSTFLAPLVASEGATLSWQIRGDPKKGPKSAGEPS